MSSWLSFCSEDEVLFDKNVDRLVVAGVCLAPVFFLSIRGWTNAILFVLVLLVSTQIFANHRFYFSKRNIKFWTILACFIIPLFTELSAQVGRLDLIMSSLDGPLRMFLAGILFVYFSRRKDDTQLTKALTIGSSLGIFSVGLSLILFPETYWHLRAATYFVDPITLPCFTVALLGIVLVGQLRSDKTLLDAALTSVAIFVTGWVAYESQSRSSWIALMGLGFVYAFMRFRYSALRQAIAVGSLVAVTLLIYSVSDVMQHRVDEAIDGAINYISTGNGQSASSGQRLAMLDIDLALLKKHFWFGLRDGHLPSYESLLKDIPTLTQETYYIKTHAGSHSEFLAQLVRKGVILGGLSLCAMFFIPLFFFYSVSKTGRLQPPKIGLGFLIPIMVSGLVIQVFNLKMTSTFYAFVLSILFAQIVSSLDLIKAKNTR